MSNQKESTTGIQMQKLDQHSGWRSMVEWLGPGSNDPEFKSQSYLITLSPHFTSAAHSGVWIACDHAPKKPWDHFEMSVGKSSSC
jgi:hypothetical protein